MSQGTRAHQLAMYVVYESPLQMLSDSPTKYLENRECFEFLKEVPTVWDETRPLFGKIGEYIGIALASDVLASAVSARTYAKSGALDIKNGLVMMCGVVTYVAKMGGYNTPQRLFLFLLPDLQLWLQGLPIPLGTLGYLVALGRSLFGQPPAGGGGQAVPPVPPEPPERLRRHLAADAAALHRRPVSGHRPADPGRL